MNPKITVHEAAHILGISTTAIFKRIKAKSLSHKKTQNKAYFGHKTAREIFGFSFKPKIIATQIVKGGTGKTAITQAVAIRSSLYGAKVLCLDLDQQANLSQSFGINVNDINSSVMIDIIKGKSELHESLLEPVEGVHLLPSKIDNALLEDCLMVESFPIDRVYKELLDPVKDEYDLIIIDCAPSLGRSVAAAALISDYVISPVTPEKSSLTGLDITHDTLKEASKKYKRKINLKVVQNKFDLRTTLSHQILTYLIKHPNYKDCLFKSYIRQSQEFPNTFYKHMSIFDSIKQSTAKEDIDLLTREILEIPVNTSETNKEEIENASD